MRCPYCGAESRLAGGDVIYPHRKDLHKLKFWACLPCDAWVGTHKNSIIHAPLGRLANAELRQAKKAAHAAFDPVWKSGGISRKDAYALLAAKMDLPTDKAHIGMFDVEQCKKVVEIFLPRLTKEKGGLVVYA